ncbi:MAG: hypothetical protein KJO98_04950 [Rhodothermia bacterium]|nr:hypothetical protein [Rhodothermia bacterium]
MKFSPSTSFRLVALVFTAVTLSACELSSSEDDTPVVGKVVVANQGNFSDGNGSVSVYDPASGESSVMASGLASIVQSVHVSNGRVHVASNTGNRVDVFDSATRDQVSQIVDVESPRYMARVNNATLLVTNLFDNSVSVINTSESRVSSKIPVGANPEGVLVIGQEAFVANHGFGGGKSISVVSIPDRSVSRTINVDCDGPRFAFRDAQAELLVVCSGQIIYDAEFNIVGTTDGAVLVLDPATGAETDRISVDGMIATAGPGQDAFYAASLRRLFVVLEQSSIVAIDTDVNAVSGTIGPIQGDPIGGVAYRAADGLLYVARVPGFTQAGSVTMLSLDGSVVSEFGTGVAPSHIDFVEE